MNKTATLILLSLATIAVAPCLASEPDTTQTIAMLGSSQTAPVLVDDAAIQRAVDTLIKQQQNHTIDIKRKLPVRLDNPVGEHPLRNSEKVLIMGGADIVPM